MSVHATAQPTMTHPVCLSIAGFDPSSGAGVTADLKTFAAHSVYGVAAITALTVQSTQGVRSLEPVRPSLFRETLECLAEDISLDGVKLGMLAGAGLVAEAEHFLRARPGLRATVVLDPVLRSSSGAGLLDAEGTALLRERLLGVVGWITPNVNELALLTGSEVRTREQVPAAAERLARQAAKIGNPDIAIVVTGGHLDRPDDYLLLQGKGSWLPGERVETRSTHGTGCAFSSALVAELVLGRTGLDAVEAAKRYVTGALRAAYPVGQGRGPLHHLFAYEPSAG
ncbi:MAG TPA: bifunctional hydroxymethylpyrimidine kinase/phosphomethylpyrimidine kinase [Acidobacteriaceae bacterium]|nr:bifunctional hydroxymethylpyrimidine kinase/phosphomethylpyrimidine kinase [Acidobacteriaceae bacterium]